MGSEGLELEVILRRLSEFYSKKSLHRTLDHVKELASAEAIMLNKTGEYDRYLRFWAFKLYSHLYDVSVKYLHNYPDMQIDELRVEIDTEEFIKTIATKYNIFVQDLKDD